MNALAPEITPTNQGIAFFGSSGGMETRLGGYYDWSRVPPRVEDTLRATVRRLFAARVGTLAGVKRIYWQTHEDRTCVWTVLAGVNRELEDRVFEEQLVLLDLFPEARFDFLVLAEGEEERIRPATGALLFATKEDAGRD